MQARQLSSSPTTTSGQVYERTGKRDQAINEYQEFLSHFESSHTRLPQVAEARTTLKRLMQ